MSLTTCTFTNNSANHHGGGLRWGNVNGYLSGCTFTNNFARDNGGGLWWNGANGTLTDSIFINNHVRGDGAGIYWNGAKGTLTNSIFINNTASRYGGAIYWSYYATNGTVSSCTFTSNTANTQGGAIYLNVAYSITDCYFNNSKWINSDGKSNGIYVTSYNLNFNGGKGIVDVNNHGTLSGISIVVLNNETYYYPPNTNINFIDKETKNKLIDRINN